MGQREEAAKAAQHRQRAHAQRQHGGHHGAEHQEQQDRRDRKRVPARGPQVMGQLGLEGCVDRQVAGAGDLERPARPQLAFEVCVRGFVRLGCVLQRHHRQRLVPGPGDQRGRRRTGVVGRLHGCHAGIVTQRRDGREKGGLERRLAGVERVALVEQQERARVLRRERLVDQRVRGPRLGARHRIGVVAGARPLDQAGEGERQEDDREDQDQPAPAIHETSPGGEHESSLGVAGPTRIASWYELCARRDVNPGLEPASNLTPGRPALRAPPPVTPASRRRGEPPPGHRGRGAA